MSYNYKKAIFCVRVLFLGVLFIVQSEIVLFAGLKEFEEDFTGNSTENVSDNKTSKQKKNTTSTTSEQNTQPVIVAQNTVSDTSSDNKLNDFYNDFNPPKNESGNTGTTNSSSTNGVTHRRRYHNFNPDYYQYYYPYYYPYYNFYPRETVIIHQYEENEQKQETKPEQIIEPANHMWFNASANYQHISDNLFAVGMTYSIVSSGKVNELSYGLKFDYNLFTERDGKEHYSLSLYDIGFTLGKQMGLGLIESYIAYCRLGDLSGLSLKLSTDQWLLKYLFVTGTLGVSLVNNSPLTELYAGIGVGSTIFKFSVGYRSHNSVNNQLSGPELKIGFIY